MYSLLPALVSVLFLAYGVYVVAKKGFTRVSASFFALCLTTFVWQASWAVLFQVSDTNTANALAKFGYLLIVFLPTSLYQFLVEISEAEHDRRWVYLSYAFAGLLGLAVVNTNWVVAGTYDYFWGFYPKAGLLHPLHVAQTLIVVSRGLYVTWRRQQNAPPGQQRTRLRLCVASLLVYLFAAIDYLCNYGYEFYPPGVVFICISLGLLMVAVTKYGLIQVHPHTVAIAQTIVHEMRTPLATISLQAQLLGRTMPRVMQAYQVALEQGLLESTDEDGPTIDVARLLRLSSDVAHQVERANTAMNMMLASARMENLDQRDFVWQSARACVEEAINAYPFNVRQREKVRLDLAHDFEIYGSQTLLIYVLFNLLKNALWAIQEAGKGEVVISLAPGASNHTLYFLDTGSGVPATVLPHIFDAYFTTKKSAGIGIGLAFCKRVVESSRGQIDCTSVQGEYTRFTLAFPPRELAPKAIR